MPAAAVVIRAPRTDKALTGLPLLSVGRRTRQGSSSGPDEASAIGPGRSDSAITRGRASPEESAWPSPCVHRPRLSSAYQGRGSATSFHGSAACIVTYTSSLTKTHALCSLVPTLLSHSQCPG
ncbi:hypothetical protein MTO96_005062 [Rhipicephalus appendiculatus]